MLYCPKCGSKVDEEMTFCPKCGASLKVERATPATSGTATVTYRRDEKAEKGEKSEKSEKHEKGEKHEKREHGFMGPLIGGVILIFIGFALYLQIANPDQVGVIWALFFVLVGLLVIVGGIYGAVMASRRHPKT